MRKVIFIDRDGVINKDPGGWTEHSYVTDWKYFIFIQDSVEALRKLNSAGYDIIVTSNQGGISKGYYTEEKLCEINKRMLEELDKMGVRILKTYYCIHQDKDNCDCRKPRTGLFKRAEKELGVKAAGAYYVGDKNSDIEVGKRMGMKSILVLGGKTPDKDVVKDWPVKPDFIFNNFAEAVDFILKGDAK